MKFWARVIPFWNDDISCGGSRCCKCLQFGTTIVVSVVDSGHLEVLAVPSQNPQPGG